MDKELIIVSYGELSTKGKNIMNFIKLLGNNIKRVLKKYNCQIDIKKDHTYIYYDLKDYEDIKYLLERIPGIMSFYPALVCNKNIDEILKTADQIYTISNLNTFKVQTKRIDKSFELNSDEINRKVGTYILNQQKKAKVDVHNPELLINIAIRENEVYIYGFKEKGLGGYPVGIAGKALHLLSGGIDSPLAAFLMMKRGVTLEMIHFEASPYTSERVIDKIKDIIHVLNLYQENIKLHIVPFAKLEKEIYDKCGSSYAVTIMRRMMMLISSIIANKRKCLVLSNGESIGQVASQTLPSIEVIEKCAFLPVIRPLACVDKIDIIKMAKEIGTYDISIRPFEDCCTIFEIKDPVTHPNLETVEKLETKIDVDTLIKECVSNTKIISINNQEEEI